MLYLVRHGSTELNAGDPADPTDYFRGWVEVPLSDTGRAAGAKTAQYLADKQISAIASSDLSRASETAAMIKRSTGAPISTDYRLRPWDIGDYTGQPITQDRIRTMTEIQRDGDRTMPGGESYNQFLQRYVPALSEYMKQGLTQNVVVVAHHRNALAIPHLLGQSEYPDVKGPPEPGGVAIVSSSGLRSVFTPPATERAKKVARS